MRLPERYYREILAHAVEGKPNEVCGLVAVREGVPVKLWRTTNSDPNPRVRYNVEPLELLHILREIEDNGWKLGAIYHSHPATEAYPSSTDIGLAYYPETVYIIVSLAETDPVVGSFRIVDGKVEREQLELYGDSEPEPVVAIAGAEQPIGEYLRTRKSSPFGALIQRIRNVLGLTSGRSDDSEQTRQGADPK